MLDSLFLATASLFSFGQEAPLVYEQSFIIPADVPYVLEVEDPRALWDSATLFSLEGKALPEIEVLNPEGKWEDWHQEHYAQHIAPNSVLELMLFEDPLSRLVVRSPETIEVVGHFFAAQPDFWMVAASTYSPFESYGAKYKLSENAQESQLPEPKFYSREEWGADERLRLSTFVRQIFNRSSLGLPSEIDDFPTKHKPKIIQDSYEGKPLHWPVAEMPGLYKFVVHHTGEYVNPNVPAIKKDPFKTMRSIYSYHTVTLGWGDIGYHYVIDKDGNIYEGRSGGPRAIGAHTAYHNAGSIGISLMGNFQVEEPTKSQLESLSLLIADHAQRFGIDPLASSYYLQQNSKNISGHRDVTAAGRGTACPGENLHKLLPDVRQKASEYTQIISKRRPFSNMTRNMLQKSTAAQHITRQESFKKPEREILEIQNTVDTPRFRRNENSFLEIKVKNSTDFSWPKGVVMTTVNSPEGLLLNSLKSEQVIAPGASGIFKAKIRPVTVSNGAYALTIEPTFLKSRLNEITYNRSIFSYNIIVSGDTALFTKVYEKKDATVKRSGFSFEQLKASSFKAQQEKTVEKWKDSENDSSRVKVKLAYLDLNYISVEASDVLTVVADGKVLFTAPSGKDIRIIGQRVDNRIWLDIHDHDKKMYQGKEVRFVSSGILKIKNYDRGINKKVPFNSFRSDLVVRPQQDQKLLVVNELPLEEYLYGLAEQTSSEPDEKRKAVLVLARSYALVYGGERRKFKTDLYDLEDSAATSQLYLGHDWERYHSSQKALVDQTKGLVLYYGGKPVIGPYFTQSGGASSSKWNRQYPWTVGRELPYDKGLEPKGHGVGLSGNSARTLAEKGKNFREIIDYFFVGTEVKSYK